MPAFVLPIVASTDLQVYKNSLRLNTGKKSLALNATAAFFLGVHGMFSTDKQTHEAEVVWILVVFCFSSHDTIPSSRSFLSFHFCEGNELHPGIPPEGIQRAKKSWISTKQGVAICEFKSHPKSNLFQR